MAFLKKNWCLMIITTLLFLLVYTIYTSSIPLPDVVNHVDDHITVGFSQIETDNPWRTTQINSFREAFGPSNIEFIYHEPEEYTAKWQQEDITKLIREKVDYLVIVPADLDALVPALESAKKQEYLLSLLNNLLILLTGICICPGSQRIICGKERSAPSC